MNEMGALRERQGITMLAQQLSDDTPIIHNPSGFKPTEYKILVKADDVAVVSKGGILIPIESQDSEKYKQTRGTIIAVSPLAFSYATQEEWNAVGGKPTVGDRILYARFGGVVIKGPKDGKEYTVLNDKDVIGTIEE